MHYKNNLTVLYLYNLSYNERKLCHHLITLDYFAFLMYLAKFLYYTLEYIEMNKYAIKIHYYLTPKS